MIFGQQREQFRQVFVDVWQKRCAAAPMEPLEHSIAAVIDLHPEYHKLLAEPDSLVRDFPADGKDANPFLHMAMHISIIEQITSDRPAGIRAMYDALRKHFRDSHDLEHAMMQCLADSLWEARERGQTPDEKRYLACIRRLHPRML